LIPKESRQRMELILKDIIANSYCYNIEDVLFTKDEKELPVSFSASVLNDSKGRIQGIMYIIKDITSIKNSEELLRRKIQDLNTFVYKASHELKGPLDSIMGLANLAKREVKGTNVEQHIDYIIDMTQRLNTNLINLLQISQVTQGKIEMKEIDIEALVNDVLRSVEHIKGFNSVKVEVKVNLESSIVSDFRMLTSIFQNLLENGIKYQRDDIDDSFIKVIIRDDENSYFIEVADNGIGLEDHEQELIFDMFYRSDNIVESIEGTGLGMYIVKESVQKLKGGIKISSEINHGTSFDIVIPKEAILMKV
ncbi:MAG: HAMP domain-containing histidine kinase, partial [Bacteroidetes bacterium]|nr:HAMP domain-containing histidine kinase [Bacteroidota bacterium]